MATKAKSPKRAKGRKRTGATPAGRSSKGKAASRKTLTRKAATRKSASRKSGARKTKPKAKTGTARSRVAATVKQKTLQGLEAVKGTGERAWDVLKSTTSSVVEGVKERIGPALSEGSSGSA